MDTYGCPSCNLCGVGNELTLPDNTIALFNTTYECSYVEEVSKQGFFTVDSCSYFSNLAQIPCGCTPINNIDGSDGSDNLVGDYSTILDAACSAHSECIAADLQGDCCPTNTGDILGCCDIPTIEIDDGSNITTTVVPTTTTTAPSIDVVDDEIDIDGSSNFTTDAPTISESTSSPTTVTLSPGVCNICPDGIVNPDGVISMMPGSEISCSEATTVANNGGIIGDELCEAVQKEASLPCCGIELITVVVDEEEEPATTTTTTTPEDDEDNISCSPCGPNKIMTSEQNEVSVPTQGVYTCIQLKQMGLDGTLDNNGICSLVQSSSQKACGCISDGSPTVAPSMSSPSSSGSNIAANDFPTAMMAGDNNAAASGAAATTTTVAAGISMSVIIITVAVATISTIASLS